VEEELRLKNNNENNQPTKARAIKKGRVVVTLTVEEHNHCVHICISLHEDKIFSLPRIHTLVFRAKTCSLVLYSSHLHSQSEMHKPMRIL
jgi:hypothetical protein